MGEEVSGVEEVAASRLSSMAIPESDTHLTAMGLAIQSYCYTTYISNGSILGGKGIMGDKEPRYNERDIGR